MKIISKIDIASLFIKKDPISPTMKHHFFKAENDYHHFKNMSEDAPSKTQQTQAIHTTHSMENVAINNQKMDMYSTLSSR